MKRDLSAVCICLIYLIICRIVSALIGHFPHRGITVLKARILHQIIHLDLNICRDRCAVLKRTCDLIDTASLRVDCSKLCRVPCHRRGFVCRAVIVDHINLLREGRLITDIAGHMQIWNGIDCERCCSPRF